MRAQVAGRGARLLTTADFRRQAAERPERALLDWLAKRSPEARMLDDVSLSRLSPCRPICRATIWASWATGWRWRTGWKRGFPFWTAGGRSALADAGGVPSRQRGESSRGDSKRVLRALLARHLPQTAQKPKRNFLMPSTLSCHLLNGPLAGHWLSMAKTRQAGIFQPAALAAALHLVAVWRTASVDGLLSQLLSDHGAVAHLIVDMFCERFPQNLARRSAMSLGELRQRLGR